MVKEIIMFGLGLIVGGAGGVMATKYILDKRNAEDAKSVREYYKEKYGENVKCKEKSQEEEKSNLDEKISVDDLVTKDSIDWDKLNKDISNPKKTNYCKFAGSSESEDNTEKEEITRVAVTKEAQESWANDNDIYPITPNEYRDRRNDYDKVCLTYFVMNEEFLDLNNKHVDAMPLIGGPDNLDFTGQYSTNTLYIRNDKTQCDYEIWVETETTVEEFLGTKDGD